jgi:lysophospholipase-1
MMTAWYMPSTLSPYPSNRPELEDPEDEDGLLRARGYVESLIDDLVVQGIPPNRIVLGGFSQGHAVTLLTGLTSARYAGKLAGLVGLSGYLPLQDRIQQLRTEAGLCKKIGDVPMFIVRGTKDVLVPKRHLRLQLEKLKELGVADDVLEVHKYEGLGHTLSPQELRDLSIWLEKVIPALEG